MYRRVNGVFDATKKWYFCCDLKWCFMCDIMFLVFQYLHWYFPFYHSLAYAISNATYKLKTQSYNLIKSIWYSKLHFIESLVILCYICSNCIIHNISFEDFIANIAMDIPSYISLNQLKYYVTYVAIVLLIRNRFHCHGSDS